MDISALPPDQVASLIARILNEKDPASVGLRRIIRRKTADADDFPMRAPAIEEFSAPGKVKKLLSNDERRIIEIERQVNGLKAELAKQPGNARKAVEKAYQKGFDEGIAQGAIGGKSEAGAEYQQKIEAVQARVGSYLKSIEDAKHALLADTDRILLDLCCRMVKKVLSAELTQRPDIILNVLRKALSYVAEREKLIIRVAPCDIETVSGNQDFWSPVTERLKAITIEPDERIGQGGCIIESASGVIDARLDVQVDELAELIEKAWEGATTTNNTQVAAKG
jgi:flagellar assembly protein FliH